MMLPRPNTTINSKEHYLSYNYCDTDHYGSDTTAIVIGQMQRFYILNGNHMEQLKDKTFEECIEYFLNNSSLKNKHSDIYKKEDATKVIEEYREFNQKKS